MYKRGVTSHIARSFDTQIVSLKRLQKYFNKGNNKGNSRTRAHYWQLFPLINTVAMPPPIAPRCGALLPARLLKQAAWTSSHEFIGLDYTQDSR